MVSQVPQNTPPPPVFKARVLYSRVSDVRLKGFRLNHFRRELSVDALFDDGRGLRWFVGKKILEKNHAKTFQKSIQVSRGFLCETHVILPRFGTCRPVQQDSLRVPFSVWSGSFHLSIVFCLLKASPRQKQKKHRVTALDLPNARGNGPTTI